MRIPARPHRLTTVLEVGSRDVEVQASQAHVLKHPFGLGALYNLPPLGHNRRWDAEGWNETDPVVLSGDERAKLAREIQTLEVESRRCGADRLGHTEFRGDAPHRTVPCYDCPSALAEACADVTSGVGERYARSADRLLGALDDAVDVGRREASLRLFDAARKPGRALPVVLSTGMLNNGSRGARINGPDGVRVELYLTGGTLGWRTTYRVPPRTRADRVSHLLEVLPPVRGVALSGRVLVPRRWWERSSS